VANTGARHHDADVVVVGAGLAGLVAARDLSALGLDVLVLESRDRIGGRLYARELANGAGVADMGGTWIIPDEHPGVVAELQRYGIGTVRTPVPDTFVTALGTTTSAAGRLGAAAVGRLSAALAGVAAVAAEEASLGEALHEAGADPDTYAWTRAVLRFLNGADLDEVSARDFADYPVALLTDPDHYTHEVVGTTRALVDAIAADSGARLELGAQVRALRAGADDVSVTTAAGAVLSARAAVLAVPINTLGAIDLDPAPRPAQRLAARGHAGHSVKLWISARNVPGVPRFLSSDGPLAYTRFVRRLEDGVALLVAFSSVPAVARASVADVQDMLRAFVPGIEVTAVETFDWNSDPHANGTWLAARPGQSADLRALASHEGRLVFVGGDVSGTAPGTIEGAVVTGAHAAARIGAMLHPQAGSESYAAPAGTVKGL
jgi:(S)-6-hydroxynicotine oxidase